MPRKTAPNKDTSSARGRHHVEDELLRDQCPDPALIAVGPPTRLIHIQDRFARQLLLQLLNGLRDRLTNFFPSFLGASQANLDTQHVGQHGFHQPPRQPADYRPIGDQRRQLRPEVSRDLLWQWRARGLATVDADYMGKLIFGDVRLYGRDFRHLMPPWLSLRNHLAGLLRQVSTAVSALLGQHHLDGAHLRCGNQGSVMPRMSALATGFSPALMLSAAGSLLTGQSVAGRWFGGVRRVPLAQSQLPFQIGDLLLGIGDLLLTFHQQITELVNLSLLPLDLLLQFLAAGTLRVRMAMRRCLWSPRAAMSRCRTHPPYVKRSGRICSAKSATITKAMQPCVNPCP